MYVRLFLNRDANPFLSCKILRILKLFKWGSNHTHLSDTQTEGWRRWGFCLVPQIKFWIQVSLSHFWSSTRVPFCRWWVPSAIKEEETLLLYLILAALCKMRPLFTTLLLCIAVASNKLHWMLSPLDFAKSNEKYSSNWETKYEGRKLGGKEGHQAFNIPHYFPTLSPFQSTCWVRPAGQPAACSHTFGTLWMLFLQGH